MKSVHGIRLAITAMLALLSVPGFAHPKLISSIPAPRATLTNARQVSLTFSETLATSASSVALIRTGMPGMSRHAPMKVAGFETSVAADGKTLVVTFPRPLPAGAYRLDWHAVSADAHRIAGSLSFTVR